MDYTLTQKPAFTVIGRRRTTPFPGGTWQVAREDGSVERLEALDNGKPFLGLCFGFGQDGSNDYMVGIEHGEPVEGLESFTYPAHAWLVYSLSGKISEDVLGNAWWYVNNKILTPDGYQKDALPTIESYVEWDDDKDACTIEIQIPYIKAQG